VTITLNTLMTSASFGDAQASRGPWTINIVATKLQNWLQANGAASATVSAATGHLVINLNTTSLNLAFRDQSATTDGSSAADAEIGFDADGNGTVDQTVFGFSYFFGLNDFFVDNLAENVKESDVQSASFSSGAATLVFRDSTGAMTGSPVTITAGSSLSTIATTINNAVPNVTASVVPDGAGFRLRIAHDQGSSFVLTQTAGTLLTTLGMHEADVRVASALTVRSDIVDSPSLISRGMPQWNANLGAAGQYFMSVGDDTVVQALATKLTTNVSFKQAGGLGAISTTLTEYATNILARNANLADSQKTDSGFARALAESLQQKSDDVRGVNLDEEMATLIQFQQAYSAAARVITTIQKMFDALDRAVA
jgi:flagellar hook-associated protein 1 FlgK